jgi:hypothetical protein
MASQPDGVPARSAEDGPIPTGTVSRRGAEMNHPLLMYELAKLKIAEDLRQAERDRLVREAGASRTLGSIDAVPFRERVVRLFGTVRPSTRGGATAGA